MHVWDEPGVWIGLAVVLAGLVGYFIVHRLSGEARERRKRRRNYGRVITKARRPVVTLKVQTPRKSK